MTEYILIFDSGSGGKYVLGQFEKVLPAENYIFFCDKKNCPYGNKSKEKLESIAINSIKKITEKYHIKMIIVACNTLSSMLKQEINSQFCHLPVLFIQPKISLKILKSPTLLIATTNTINHNKIIQKYDGNINLYLQSFATLAKKIDEQDYEYIKKFLKQKLTKYKSSKIKNVVLGCTHYNYIKDEIKNVLGEEITFLENSKNIAIKAKKILIRNNKLQSNCENPDKIFIDEI